MSCVTLSGKGGGRLSEMMRPEDIEIIVDGDSTPRIQEVHGLVVHCLCDLVDFHLTGHAQ